MTDLDTPSANLGGIGSATSTDETIAEAFDDAAERSSSLGWARRSLLGLPSLVLVIFFLGPFLLMFRTSFNRRIQGGFYEPAWVLESWRRVGSDFYIDRVLFSIQVCLVAALVTVAVAFPFTWFLSRLRASVQVPMLIMILAALTLSEVIVAFAWDLILGRSSGVSNIAVWLGLMDEPKAFTPGYVAVLFGLAYIAFPYCVLTLYPSLSRIDDELTEASETLGASPLRTFWSVVVPLCRVNLVAAFLLVFVFTLGSYIVAQVLGRPEHWTMSVFISDQATFNSNVPFAAAMAMLLTIVSLAIVAITTKLTAKAAL